MSTKEAAKPLQECVKETETIELYFQQGSSDKVYHLQLESVGEQWSVNAQWGRRSSALQSDAKVSSVAYLEAKRVFLAVFFAQVAPIALKVSGEELLRLLSRLLESG